VVNTKYRDGFYESFMPNHSDFALPLRHRKTPLATICVMADFLSVVGIVAFVAIMLGLIWALDRV
jgi:hypothetical protein